MGLMNLTPEQELEVERRIQAAKNAVHDEYDARAHKFRNWLNTHTAVWAAQRVGTVAFILGGVLAYYVGSLIRAIFG